MKKFELGPSTGALAIFSKTPGLSPVKTRLAKDLGVSQANTIFLRSLAVTADVVVASNQSQHNFEVFWAVAEPEALTHPFWETQQKFKLISQGQGGLGAKLHRVYSELLCRFPFVALIGGDAPLVSWKVYETVARALQQGKSDFVLGPTHDGGYFVFAGTKEVPLSVWESIPYSDPSTFTIFAKGLEALGTLTRLEPHRDIDLATDIRSIREDFALGEDPNWMESQRAFFRALETCCAKVEFESKIEAGDL